MANDKKFVVKNGLQTPNILVGTSTDDGSNKLQLTGNAKITGVAEATGNIIVGGNLLNNASGVLVPSSLGSSGQVLTVAPNGTDAVWADTGSANVNLGTAGDSGTGTVALASQSLTISGTTNEIETTASGQAVTVGLPNDVTIGNELTVTTALFTPIIDTTDSSALTVTPATTFSSDINVQNNITSDNFVEAAKGFTMGGINSFRFLNGDDSSFAIGPGALQNWAQNSSGWNNIAIGKNVLAYQSSNGSNIGIGTNSQQESDGFFNVGIGRDTLFKNSSQSNVAIGDFTLTNLFTGQRNTAVGYVAGNDVVTGTDNTMIGAFSQGQATGSYNTSVGYAALENASSNNNTAIGWFAGNDITSGTRNVAMGAFTLDGLQTGNDNTALGNSALGSVISGSFNVGLGRSAGFSATGSNNTFLGANSALSVSSGSNLTVIGYEAEPSSGSATNEITLGGDTSNKSFRIPGSSFYINGGSEGTTGSRVGINTNAPTEQLDVNGNIAVSGTVDGRDIAADGSKLDGIESGATADQTASEILTAIKTVDGSGSGLDADLLDGIQASAITQSGDSVALTGDVTGSTTVAADGAISIATTIAANSVELGTDTSGNYVATITGTANEVEVSGSGSESAAVTIGLPNDVTIGNDLTVTGDLIVNGTTTTVNSNTVEIGDSIITLNSDEVGTPSQNAGIEVERGTSTNVQLRWNETNDKWEVTEDGAAYSNILTTADEGTGNGLDADTVDGVEASSFLRSDAADTKTSGDLNFSDNIKAVFGAGSDLQIYHDGSGSYIAETGDGPLYIKGSANVYIQGNSTGETLAQFAENGAVTLYYDAAAKIATTSTGVDVTGNIVVSGTVDGRDVAADGTKLDGIEAGATADQTASEILTAIKTVDGSGSGLDADLLDGLDSGNFLRSDTSDTFTSGTLTFSSGADLKGGLQSKFGNFYAPQNPEGTHLKGHAFFNDIAYARLRGSTISVDVDGTAMTNTTAIDDMLSPTSNFWNMTTSGVTTVTITITSIPSAINYTAYMGVNFGHTTWRAKDITLEYSTDNGSTWSTAGTFTDQADEFVVSSFSTGATATNALRWTLEDFNTTSMRINGLFAYDYNSPGMSGLYLPLGGGTVYGNLGVSGTVDGRDVAADGTKLDGIESGATADQTASEILTAIKTVDGSGSGLDADLLDGIEGASFLRSDAADTATGNLTFDGTVTIDQQIIHKGDTNTYIEYHAADSFRVVTGGTERLEVTNSGVRFSDAFTLPTSDGSANQVLTTDGSGTVTWADGGSSSSARTEAFPTVTNGSANVTMAASYTLAQIDVYLNGARMKGGTDYSVSGTTLTFSENLTTGDVVALYAYDTAENLITGNWSDLNDVSVTGAATNTMVRFDGGNYVAASTTEDSSGNLSVSGNATLSGNLSVGGNATLTGDLTVSGGQIIMPTVATRDKYRLWDSSTYAIGMDNAISFGGLSDYAMTFQFSNNDARGFWFGDSTHTDAQGAMALTTNGKLTVAHSARIGYGEADTTTPGADHALDVNGSVSSTVGTNVRTFVATNGTQYISLVSDLTSGGYNPISAAGDVGIIFTTDNDIATDESGKGLVIAPWAQTAAKGIKIQENGNVGIGTSSPSTELEVNGTITDDVGDVRIPRWTAISTATTIANEGVYYCTGAPTVTLGSPAVGTVMTIYNNNNSAMTLNRGSGTIAFMRKGADNDQVNHTSATLGGNSTTTVTIFNTNFAVVTGTDVT